MRREANNSTMGVIVLALGLSGAAHVVLATGLLQILEQRERALRADRRASYPVEMVKLRPRPWVADPPPRLAPAVPRLGDRQPPSHQAVAADTLADHAAAGALAGEGQARPHPDPLAGQELDDLRSRPFNHPDRDTPSRIRTAKKSISYDNERRTPNPRRSPRLTSGAGRGTQRVFVGSTRRRHQSESDRPQTTRLAPGGEDPLVEEPGMAHLQKYLRRGRPQRDRARPEVRRGPPTVLSSDQRWAVSDRRNRQQASSRLVPDLADMARARSRGQQTGAGRGSRAGRRGDPHGRKRGLPIWLSNPDRRYIRYFRNIHHKIQPLWFFPKELEVMLMQGDVLVRFTIMSDGRVTNIRVKKSSGFPKFDRIVVAAIREAAPFGPIPRGLGDSVQVLAPFEFSNPMVR